MRATIGTLNAMVTASSCVAKGYICSGTVASWTLKCGHEDKDLDAFGGLVRRYVGNTWK